MGKYALIIVSALIFSLLTYSYALRNAIFQSNTRTVQSFSQNQAHNIAQSALMASYKDINAGGGFITIPGGGDTFETGFQQWSDLQGEYNIRVFNDDVNNVIRVQSTGRFENTEYSATAGLVLGSGGGGFPWPALDKAIHSDEDMSIVNGDVYGDVFSGGKFSIPNNGHVHGDVYVVPDETNAVSISSGGINGSLYANTTKANGVQYNNWNASISGNLSVGPGADPDVVAPKISQWHWGHVGGSKGALSEPIPPVELELPEFPDPPATPISLGDISINGGPRQDMTIDLNSGNAYTPSISVGSNRSLTIIVGNKDRTLRVGNFDMHQGHLNIIQEGEGRLQLYVDDYFNIGGSSSLNNNSNPGGNERSPLNLLIAYGGSSEFNVGGAQPINGNIYIKDADLEITGSGNIDGNIITGGERVNITGAGGNNSRVVYAPNAHVTMTGSGSVNGSVVSKSFEGRGSFDVVYTTEFGDTLPNLDGGSGGGGSTTYNIAFWY